MVRSAFRVAGRHVRFVFFFQFACAVHAQQPTLHPTSVGISLAVERRLSVVTAHFPAVAKELRELRSVLLPHATSLRSSLRPEQVKLLVGHAAVDLQSRFRRLQAHGEELAKGSAPLRPDEVERHVVELEALHLEFDAHLGRIRAIVGALPPKAHAGASSLATSPAQGTKAGSSTALPAFSSAPAAPPVSCGSQQLSVAVERFADVTKTLSSSMLTLCPSEGDQLQLQIFRTERLRQRVLEEQLPASPKTVVTAAPSVASKEAQPGARACEEFVAAVRSLEARTGSALQ